MSEGVTGGGGGERVRVCGGGESEGEELERVQMPGWVSVNSHSDTVA